MRPEIHPNIIHGYGVPFKIAHGFCAHLQRQMKKNSTLDDAAPITLTWHVCRAGTSKRKFGV